MKELVSLLLGTSLFASSCVSLQTVSLTQVPMERNHEISASVDKFIFLAFNFDNDFVDQLTPKLKDQCPGGQIKGILTKDEVVSYVLAHTRRVTASGFCVK